MIHVWKESLNLVEMNLCLPNYARCNNKYSYCSFHFDLFKELWGVVQYFILLLFFYCDLLKK